MNRIAKRKSIYTILLLTCVVGFWLFDNFYTPDTYSAPDNSSSKTEIPEYLLPSSTTGEIVEHQHYSLSYNEPYEQAEWVVYLLKKEHLTSDDRKRPYFIEDPEVTTKSADWRNYKGSGYDRGHLCPAGDRRFSKQAYDETFYTSNISPQDNDFNTGIWNRLEQKVRRWAKSYKTVFVATGGVLEDGLSVIGDEDVAVPKYYYKIVSRGDANNLKIIAFLIPGNESLKPLQNFVVTVDEIEQLTGIDFFEKLPDAIETKLEDAIDKEAWKF